MSSSKLRKLLNAKEPPAWLRPAVMWLIAGLAITAYFTHQKVSFTQGGGPDRPVNWVIITFWVVTASIGTFGYWRVKRVLTREAHRLEIENKEQESEDNNEQ